MPLITIYPLPHPSLFSHNVIYQDEVRSQPAVTITSFAQGPSLRSFSHMEVTHEGLGSKEIPTCQYTTYSLAFIVVVLILQDFFSFI
jgi:hypothetical protein